MAPRYDALVLDLDGTIICADGGIRPRTFAALQEAARRGTRVMIATGRSDLSAKPVLEQLGFDTEAIVFNGAATFSPRLGRLIESYTLSDRVRDTLLDHAKAEDYLPVVMFAGRKYVISPRSEVERIALSDMTNLQIVPESELRAPNTIRVTLFSSRHETSDAFCVDVVRRIDAPVFTTHFPLNLLAQHRDSPLHVLDVHPPCAGKAEAFRVLESRYGIPAERVVAVGDAFNDVAMLAGAGLGVCMEEATEDVRRVSKRVIGPCESDTVAELVEELFL